jgi:segregation and condensation protein B
VTDPSDGPAAGASDVPAAGANHDQDAALDPDAIDLPDLAVLIGQPADPWPPSVELEQGEPDPATAARRDLEAILLLADEPVTVTVLARVLEMSHEGVEDLLVDLAGEYAGGHRGFVLRAVAGGWRLFSHPAAAPRIQAWLKAGTQARLTQAALETLAVIAYRQPVARGHVAAVRGVNVDGVLRTLINRGLIHEVGRDDGPGQAVLYGTTPHFLEQLGLHSLDELPPVADYLPEGVDLSELEESW